MTNFGLLRSAPNLDETARIIKLFLCSMCEQRKDCQTIDNDNVCRARIAQWLKQEAEA